MEVYLLRHGIAEDPLPGQDDAARALVPEGRHRVAAVLKAARSRGLRPDLILSSPFKRALQTAEIAQAVLEHKENIAQSAVLVPSGHPQDVWEEIRAHREIGSLLLVGHNPLFSELASYLLNEIDGPELDFKKGSLMRIDFTTFTQRPHGTLRWHLTAKDVRQDS